MPSSSARATSGGTEGQGIDGRRARGALTLARLLAAASTLFRTQGFSHVTLEEIARTAGVSGPAIYRHFQNKVQILEVLLTDANAVLFAPLPSDLQHDPRAVLEGYFRQVVQVAIEHPDSISLYRQEWQSLPPETRKAQAQALSRRVGELARVLRQASDGISLAEARLRVGVAFEVACHVGHPGSTPSLGGEARSRLLLDLVMGILLGARERRASVLTARPSRASS
jgi:AcrR family transcriptional regulator